MSIRLRTSLRNILYRMRNLNRNDPLVHHYFDTQINHPRGDVLIHRTLNEGIFENDVVKTIRKFLRPDSVYFDVGSNVGLLAVPFLRDNRLQVHSFEPSPLTLRYLRKTIQHANCQNWHLHEFALGAFDGDASFLLGGEHETAFAGLRSTGRTASETQVMVRMRTLDSLWRELGQPSVSVIKIDIEGGEIDAFRGGFDCIGSTLPAIVVEIDPLNFPNYSQTAESIYQFIQSMGYEIYQIPDYTRDKPHYHRITSPADLLVNLSVNINYLLISGK
jgi:FkbM family methyltransferase